VVVHGGLVTLLTESKQNADEQTKLAVGELFHVMGTSNDEQDGINGRDCSLPPSSTPANITELDVEMVSLDFSYAVVDSRLRHQCVQFAATVYEDTVKQCGTPGKYIGNL